MEGSEMKDNFEKQWAEAFENAESSPSPHVWKNISHELANQQVSGYKKRLFWFQLAAAASLVLAAALGALYFFSNNELQHQQIAQEQQTIENKQPMTISESDAVTSNEGEKDTNKSNISASKSSQVAATEKNIRNTAESPSQQSKDTGLIGGDPKNEVQLANFMSETDASDNNTESNIQETIPLNIIIDKENMEAYATLSFVDIKEIDEQRFVEMSQLPAFFYKVPITARAEEVITGEKREIASLFAGINVGSGSFDPNFGAPMGAADESFAIADFEDAGLSNSANLPLQERNTPGVAFSFGLDVGKQISDKWVLQSGLQYGQYTVNSNTNLVFSTNSKQAVPLSFQNNDQLFRSEAVEVSAANVDLSNRFELLTIPIQAGFVLLDQKFNVVLNGGFSGSFYLGNELQSESSSASSFSFDPGSDSPYRTLHINALTSVQLGYRLDEHYFISITPNYRHSITDFAKAGNTFSSLPSHFGLNLGFRYLFK